MDSEMLTDQRELVEQLESNDWTITDVELTLVEEPFSDDDPSEATLTLSATKEYGETDDDDDRNPFRVN